MELAIQKILETKKRSSSRRSSYALFNKTYELMNKTHGQDAAIKYHEILEDQHVYLNSEIEKMETISKLMKSKSVKVSKLLKVITEKKANPEVSGVELSDQHKAWIEAHSLKEEYLIKYLRISKLRQFEDDLSKMKEWDNANKDKEVSVLDKIFNKRISSNFYTPIPLNKSSNASDPIDIIEEHFNSGR